MDSILFYFSGTGNSRYLAEHFSKIMKERHDSVCEVHSIEEDINVEGLLVRHDVIGFCYPIYGSGVPAIMRDFAARIKPYLDDKKVFLFCTQLIFSGDGARAFTDLLSGLSYEVIYAEHFNMPNNLCNIPFFRVKNGAENAGKISRAMRKLERTCANFSNGDKRLRGFHPISKLLGLTQRPAFLKMEREAASKATIDHNACVRCGLCVKECPTHNFAWGEDKITTSAHCTLCYRCVNHCPKQAIRVWIDRPITRQYKGIET